MTMKEKQNFRAALSQQRDSSKSLKLLDVLYRNPNADDEFLRSKVLGKNKTKATSYSMLKLRLYLKLIEFFKDEFNNTDSTGHAQAASLIYVAQSFISRKVYPVAKDLLTRAESIATQNHHFNQLQLIYELKLAHPEHLADDFDSLLAEARNNEQVYHYMFQLNLAFAEVRKELAHLKLAGKTFSPEATIRKLLKPFPFASKHLRTNPVFMHRLAELWRSVIVSGKSYRSFEPFLRKAYFSLQSAESFREHNAHLQLEFLYMLAHVYYRTRNYPEAQHWNAQVEEALKKEEFKTHHLLQKQIALSAGIQFCTGNCSTAVAMLQKALLEPNVFAKQEELQNMQLNLSVYLFFQRQFKEANKVLRMLPPRSKELELLLGTEWFFKRDLIEVVFQCELEKPDLALKYLQRISKDYAQLLSEATYQRAIRFMQFVEVYISFPERVSTPEFITQVNSAKMGQGEDEDTQALLFSSWLRSKMHKKDAYTVFLERVRG